MWKSGPLGINTSLNFSINRITLQYMAIMTLTALSGLYGFVVIQDERAGLILTFAAYIVGILSMKIWNNYRPAG